MLAPAESFTIEETRGGGRSSRTCTQINAAADAIAHHIAAAVPLLTRHTHIARAQDSDGHRADQPHNDAQTTADVVVALSLRTSALLVAAQLAVARLGCAFCLLDPKMPRERSLFILDDSHAALLVVEATTRDAPESDLPRVAITDSIFDEPPPPCDVARPGTRSTCGQLLYICYTSGSTGAPKGCAVEREALCSYARANAAAHGIGPSERVLLASAQSFDPFIGETWTAMLAGAVLCLEPCLLAERDLAGALAASRATHVCSTPAAWASVPPETELPQLRCVCLGGESMGESILRTWASRVALYNVYGVTEATVYQASRRMVASASFVTLEARSIGQPLEGCGIVLVDEELQVQPRDQGSEGQIAILGRQLARGYWRRDALTSSAYVTLRLPPQQLPLGGLIADDGGCVRAYLTGDYGRWHLSDGGATEVEFVGRTDHQVKLNGTRVELGEVEGVLGGSALVAHAAALLVEGSLVAAVALREGRVASSKTLAASAAAILALRCRRWLPRAARPRHIFALAEIPQTPTGKLDRCELKSYLAAELGSCDPAVGRTDTSPRGALERALAALWSEVLGVPESQVSRYSNFLTLGGDSLKALYLVRRMRMHLRHHFGPVKDVSWREVTSADEADFGVQEEGIPFMVSHILRLPLLHAFAAFLESEGVRAPESAPSEESLEGFAAEQQLDARSGGVVLLHEADRDDSALAELAELSEAEASLEDGTVASEMNLLALLLTLAARYGALSVMDAALAEGADPSPRIPRLLRGGASTIKGALTPLHEACRLGSAPIVRRLLDARATVTCVSAAGDFPLHLAAEEPARIRALEALLATDTRQLVLRNAKKQTALHVAARAGNRAAVCLLLDARADVATMDRWHRTALQWAVVNGQIETVAALVDAGASANMSNVRMSMHKHMTSLPLEAPLHTAARLPLEVARPMARLLVNAGADVQQKDQFGRMACDVLKGVGVVVDSTGSCESL